MIGKGQTHNIVQQLGEDIGQAEQKDQQETRHFGRSIGKKLVRVTIEIDTGEVL